jgi:hypothetical protein
MTNFGDAAVIAHAARNVGNWLMAQTRDSNLVNSLNVDINTVITQRGLIDVLRLQKRWSFEIRLFKNGSRTGILTSCTDMSMDMDRFTWFMTLVIAALDVAVPHVHFNKIVFDLLSQISKDTRDGMQYLLSEPGIHIQGWRSTACLLGISIRSRHVWKALAQGGERWPGWDSSTASENILQLLVWLLSEETPSFATTSTNTFCFATVLHDIGFERVFATKIISHESPPHGSLLVVLDTRMPAAAAPNTSSIDDGGHGNFTSYSELPVRLIERLGVGASAVVDIVEDKQNGQRFAQKSYRPCPRSKNRLREALANEVQIMKRVHSHPHIVFVYWSYTCPKEFGMLLTPIASHGDLEAYLHAIQESGGHLSPEQRLILGRSFGCLASGLAHIHSYTIRHKDIKPQNILVHNGQMLYTDFGIAIDVSGQDTTTTGFPGAHTKRYCAPEVANYEPRNRKSDVFSLGCVFVEILAVLVPGTALSVASL